jgi:hypothetical protein
MSATLLSLGRHSTDCSTNDLENDLNRIDDMPIPRSRMNRFLAIQWGVRNSDKLGSRTNVNFSTMREPFPFKFLLLIGPM